MKRVYLIAGSILVMAGLAGGGVWFFKRSKASSNTESTGGQVSMDSSGIGQAAELKVSTSDVGQLFSPNPSSGSADTNSANSQPSSDQPKTLTPQDFKQFDQYKDAKDALFIDMKKGDGPEAAVGKQVTVNYRGWLTDGREFDESYAKGKPFSFVPGQHQVILGWEEGILGMKVGGQRLLIVPPAAGYGSQGKDPIPPNAVLVFAIELVGVQ